MIRVTFPDRTSMRLDNAAHAGVFERTLVLMDRQGETIVSFSLYNILYWEKF